ncbi:MAG: tripartite tricarboxylate transporter substrate-binding protein [Usitatibacter sp.]
MKMRIGTLVAGLATAVAAFTTGAANAQYPTHAVTLVVPFAAGGPTDTVARSLGAAMSKSLGQPVVIENKLGAGGTVAANFVAKANPDGYTIFIHHNGMATAVGLYRSLPYNPLTDFEYIGQVADVPMTLLGRKDFPPDSVKDLVAYVRANREKINLANAGLGAVSQLCGMLFMQAVGAEFTTIPFSGTAPAMVALLGGQVDLLCDQTTQTIPQIKGGKVKLYGVTTKARIPALPDAPTLDEQGLKDFQIVVWHGVYAPKGTPREALDKLNAALRSALKDPEVSKRFAELGAQIVSEDKQTPAGLRDWLKAEIDKWVPLIRKAGVYAD